MIAVILAGGVGSRIAEETATRPKPMIEIGGHPILWHIMKTYACHGITDFIVALGYKGYIIKEYFANMLLHSSDATFDLREGSVTYHSSRLEPWRVTLIETGEATATGGRLKQLAPYLRDQEAFCFTYGDGVGNVDVTAAITFHRNHRREATITAVVPPGRYGAIDLDGIEVKRFTEKASVEGTEVNGGYFVLSPKVLDRIAGDDTPWEREPLESLARDRQLCAYRHPGFWHPMDTLRDHNYLKQLWESGQAPWKIWE